MIIVSACLAASVSLLFAWRLLELPAAQEASALLAIIGLLLCAPLGARIGAWFGGFLIALTLMVIFARDPGLFLHPRFWAEEATVYFHSAWMLPSWQALLSPHQGYLSLFANAAGVAATLVPLEAAPLVTTTMAALLPLAIVGAIAFNDSITLATPAKKAAASAAAMVVGATGEIWLTTINSQHWMPLLVFLVLIDGKQARWKAIASRALVVVLGLSSVAANFLTPLFLVQYLRYRRVIDLQLFWILTSTSFVQLLTIAYSALVLGPDAYFHATQSRIGGDVELAAVARSIWFYGVVWPLFYDHWRFSALAPWCLPLLLGLCWAGVKKVAMHMAAVFVLTVLTVVGSLGGHGGERYAYPGIVIVNLMLIQLASDTSIHRVFRALIALVWALSIVVWCQRFLPSMEAYRNPTWPHWGDEVRQWRADPDRALQAHPIWEEQSRIGLFWATRLPPEERR